MKRIIIWLSKVFNVNLTVEKIVYKDRFIIKQVALEGTIKGDIYIEGNLIVEGVLTVQGEISCYKSNN